MIVPKSFDFCSETSFKEAFDGYFHALCFYAGRILGEDHAVYDMVQEVFLRMWERRMAFETAGAMKAYLYSAVYNACMNRIKSTSTHKRHHLLIKKHGQDPLYDEITFLADRIEAEVLAEVFMAIERLPTECRRVFEMSYVEGMSVEGVAEKLGVSVNTVKTQRSRAKKLLRESLKDLYTILVLLFLIH